MITYTKTGSALVRPDHGYAFVEVKATTVLSAIIELQRKAKIVAIGLDDFTDTERFAYAVLRDAGAFDEGEATS